MLYREWRQITSNGITRAANFPRNNKLLTVGEWKRRVVLPPSHFVDYLLPQIRRTQFVYSVATKLKTQTSEGSFLTLERRHSSAKTLTGSSLLVHHIIKTLSKTHSYMNQSKWFLPVITSFLKIWHLLFPSTKANWLRDKCNLFWNYTHLQGFWMSTRY